MLTSKHVAEDNTAIDASSLTRQFLRLEPLCSTFHRSPCCSPGAFLGSTLGKTMNGQRLLALFAVLMMVVGALMLRDRARTGDPTVRLSRENLPKLLGLGLLVGLLSGFFGIGGGFLIVPALMLAAGIPMLNAIGSSLLSVTTFGLTTAGNYAWSGLIDWPLAGPFVAGGVLGGLLGARSAKSLASRRGALTMIFAALIFVVALYMLVRSLSLIGKAM